MVESTNQKLQGIDLSNHELVRSGLVRDMLDKIFIRATLTEDELIFSRVESGAGVDIESLKQTPPTDFLSALSQISAKPHPNTVYPNGIIHIPVFKQQRGPYCGYHMYYNAQMFIKTILAATRYDQLLTLCKFVTQTGSAKYFHKHMRNTCTLLLKKKYGRYFDENRVSLKNEEVDVTRQQINALLAVDPDISTL